MEVQERVLIVEPVPVREVMASCLVRAERIGDMYRLTFGIERESLQRNGRREIVVIARMVIPCSHYLGISRDITAALSKNCAQPTMHGLLLQ